MITGIDNLRGGPDQNIGVPDRRHAMFERCLDADHDLAHAKVDGFDTWRFGKGEKGIGHEVLCVPERHGAWAGMKQIELLAVFGRVPGQRHERRHRGLAANPRETGETIVQPLGGIDSAKTGIGRGLFGAEIGPGLQILKRIDDAPADLAVFRPSAVGAMLFQRAAGETEESRGLGCPQVARRQAGQRIGHDRVSVFLALAGKIAGGPKARMAERDREGGCRRWGVAFPIPRRTESTASASAKGVVQQIEISAAHQSFPALDEPDRSIAKVVGFPGTDRDTLHPEQSCGDDAIARAVLVGVKRAQALDQTVAALNR
jgi:hypothetical protein